MSQVTEDSIHVTMEIWTIFCTSWKSTKKEEKMPWFWILLLPQLVLVDKLIFISTVIRFFNNGMPNFFKKEKRFKLRFSKEIFVNTSSCREPNDSSKSKLKWRGSSIEWMQHSVYSLDSHLECVIRVVHGTRLFVFENSTYTERCLLIGCSSGASCIHPHYLLLISYPQLLLNNINIYVLHTLYKPQPLIGELHITAITGLDETWKWSKTIFVNMT